MTTAGRAFGKVILFGEHAVVYGAPALAAGIHLGATATAAFSAENQIRFDEKLLPQSHDLYRGLEALLGVLAAPSVELELKLELPAGSGLGGSAALGVATARAVHALTGKPRSDEELLRAVDAWEAVFHGNASGVDARAAFYGGVQSFVRGEMPRPLALHRPLTLAIAIAAPPASTKEMVEGVARLKRARPDAFAKTLAGIVSITQNAMGCLRAGDLPGLGKLMDLNQMLLGTWLVSTEELETACQIARKAGALGAKLTGSGGGGAVIALTGDDPEPVLSAFRNEGLKSFAAQIGEASFHESHS